MLRRSMSHDVTSPVRLQKSSFLKALSIVNNSGPSNNFQNHFILICLCAVITLPCGSKPKGIETFAFISLFMGYLNSCINPIICMAYNKCLRQAASELVTCKRRRVSSNSVGPVIATESMDPTNIQEQGNSDSYELNTVSTSS
ncbi:hypothetical protein KUTeg_002989 [Tegillarca granosa]|uniref:G-protein coupled receptors family 1 profile domain-containing protein n=1 Tax=Tegillarca granosa TaxID=220873 RepID=A0ABQ9FKT7_TEGGR|nr:hypothetical protein KUTeg_002989 [Tegillarca granosa]